MAAPVADSYNVSSGDIVCGRYVTFNDVAGGVWTPTKDGSGNILAGSWAGLPLDEWVEVADTDIRVQLEATLNAAGWNPATNHKGTGNIIQSLNAWCGCAQDLPNSRVWVPWGGGHADSSANGIWRFDIEKMSFAVEAMPSDPYDATYPWDAAYISLDTGAGATNSYTNYPFVPNTQPPYDTWAADDMLPDSTPTSRHTYNGVWYDSTRGLIQQARESRWAYNINTTAYTREQWIDIDDTTQLNVTINHNLHYDAVTDKLFGHLHRHEVDWFFWGKFDPVTKQLDSLGGSGGSPSQSTCVIGRKIFMLTPASGKARWGLFDMDSETWTTPVADTADSEMWSGNEMRPCIYIPEWDRVIMRYTASNNGHAFGDWVQFNTNTGQHENYTPAGNVPPMTLQSGPYPGNKVFYYPPRNAVVYICPKHDGGNGIYVMRTG